MAEFKMHSQEVALNFKTSVARMVDGLAEMGMGIILILTSILLPIRVLANLTLTQKEDSRNIENNPGMMRIAEEAEKITQEVGFSTNRMHALLIDAHRKFEKSLSRKQATKVLIEAENKAYLDCKLDDPESYKRYFRLFRTDDLLGKETSVAPSIGPSSSDNASGTYNITGPQ